MDLTRQASERPITAIGALEAPSFTLDITPFVPLLTDRCSHNFTIIVRGDEADNGTTNPEWIISGSVGITLDPSGTRTKGKLTSHDTQSLINKRPLSHDEEGRIVFTTEASHELFMTAEVVTGSQGSRMVQVQQKLSYVNTQTWTPGGSFQVCIVGSKLVYLVAECEIILRYSGSIAAFKRVDFIIPRRRSCPFGLL